MPPSAYTASDFLLAEFHSAIEKSIDKKEKFNSEQFFNAYMVFHSGKRSLLMKMNYNRFLDRMELIDLNGDTVSMTDAFSVKYVVTEHTTYYNYPLNGYFQVIAGRHNSVKLMLQENLKLIHRFESGFPSYNNKNLYSTSIVIKNIDGIDTKRKVHFARKKQYYLMTKNEKFYKANMAGFIKAFPKHEGKIRRYITVQALQLSPIHFKKESDLRRLLDHCSRLN